MIFQNKKDKTLDTEQVKRDIRSWNKSMTNATEHLKKIYLEMDKMSKRMREIMEDLEK